MEAFSLSTLIMSTSKGRNWVREKLSDLPKVAQQVTSRVRVDNTEEPPLHVPPP